MPEYKCFFCDKPILIPPPEDPVVLELFDSIKHFCDDDCLFGEFERQQTGVDSYEDINNSEGKTIQ